MDINELINARNLVETEFNNLSNHAWVSTKLDFLRGKYEALNDLIVKEQQNAKDGQSAEPKDSNNNKGK